MSEPILFRPGEKAQFIRPAGIPPTQWYLERLKSYNLFYGAVITISGITKESALYVQKHPEYSGPWYEYKENSSVVVVHQGLRRIDPLWDGVGNWKDCLWKPKDLSKETDNVREEKVLDTSKA